MSTLNLGKIRFNWTGAYNNSTAYVANDVVSSGGNSYICILASTGNAVSNGTYWDLMSQAGTNGADGADGTDLSSTLTTQGDIVVKGASALERLAKGTASQQLRMNSGATGLEYFTPSAGGGWTLKSAGSVSSSSGIIITGLTKTIKVFYALKNSQNGYGIDLTMSTNNGSSFHGSNQYHEGRAENDVNAAGSFSASLSASADKIPLVQSIGNGSTQQGCGEFIVHNPENTTAYTCMEFTSTGVTASGFCQWFRGIGALAQASAVDAIKIQPEGSGTISGKYTVLEITDWPS